MKTSNVKSEIGSEYWLEKNNKNAENINFNFQQEHKYLLSGRTAIDYVLQDILQEKIIKKVYVPSYCCQSMLQAFQDNNIEIEFYDVIYNNKLEYDINLEKECDIFYAMNYFGFEETRMDYYIEKFASKKTIIIEDITHSLLSTKSYNSKSNYMIASLRKWFPIMTGGIAIKGNGKFKVNNEQFPTNLNVYNAKKEAMSKKYSYIIGEKKISKEEFLNQYKESNEELSRNYKNYNIDEESLSILKNIDINEVNQTRQRNAKIIFDNLKINKNIKFLCNMKKGDCPLFIPIIVKKEMRADLRNYLTSNKIFCPIHWPKPENAKECELYEIELSLICDQRYSEEDIKREVNILNYFFEEKES